ncbi:MAG: fluoride efflux transporter CrcB, partial [Phenylobacterium sp.]|nr:fluoride efflux transporter CrcB [Phenylobacterium sp.]
MEKLFLVAIGGGVGAVARYLLGVVSLNRLGMSWPAGTFIANVSGGMLMGLLVGWLA